MAETITTNEVNGGLETTKMPDSVLKLIAHQKEFLAYTNSQGEQPFRDYGFILKILGELGEDYRVKGDPKKILDEIMLYLVASTNEDLGGSQVTANTLNIVDDLRRLLGQSSFPRELQSYWLERLRTMPERGAERNSLASQAGYFEISVPLDRQSETGGVDEALQALAALNIDYAFTTATHATDRLPPAIESEVKDRGIESARAGEHLGELQAGTPAWLKDPRFAHLQKLAKHKMKDFTSHDPNLLVKKDGEIIRRPYDPRVRIFRPGSELGYLDISIEQLLSMPNDDQFKLIKEGIIPDSLAESDSQSKFAWTTFNSYEEVQDWSSPPPPFSLAIGAYESGNVELQKAMARDTVANICFDYGRINLQFGHVALNGAPAKIGSLRAAYALQFGRQAGEQLYHGYAPSTELRAEYEKVNIPEENDLLKLDDALEKARISGNLASDFYTNRTLIDLCRFFGIQDLHNRFAEISSDDLTQIDSIAQHLNETHTRPLTEDFQKFIEEHPTLSELSSDQVRELTKIFFPSFNRQRLFGIGISQEVGSTAINQMPISPHLELVHPHIPQMDYRDGKWQYKDPQWLRLSDYDLVLSRFGLNVFNILQLYTKDWRKGVIGAESLGGLTTPKIGNIARVMLHDSDLGTYIDEIMGIPVELGWFTTAQPGPEEQFANAMSTFTSKKGMRTTFRDQLQSHMIEDFALGGDEHAKQLPNVIEDLTLFDSPELQKAIREKIDIIKNEWIATQELLEYREFDGSPRQLLVLVKLAIANYEVIKNSDYSNPDFRAFQILLASAIRELRHSNLSNIIQME